MTEKEIGFSVELIFLLLVLVVVIFGIVFFGIPEKIKNVLPDFGGENVVVKLGEDAFLENPELIVFQYNDGTLRGDGFGVGDVKYRCSEEKNWEFYGEDKEFFRRDAFGKIKFKDDASSWISVEGAESWYKFIKYIDEDKTFILSLKKKGCEKGLMSLVERMLKEDTSLTIRIGSWAGNYNKKDKLIKNLDMFIDKLNQISRGVKNG